MMRISEELSRAFTLLAILAAYPATQAIAQDKAANGKVIAMQWCSSCHVVADDQAAASADVPTFRSIAAKYGDDVEVLAAFLADPHPPMPKLSLSRIEIVDLVAYITSLR